MIRCFHHRYTTVFLASTLVVVCAIAQQVSVPVPDAHARQLYEIIRLIEKSAVLRCKALEMKLREEQYFEARLYSKYNDMRFNRLEVEERIEEIHTKLDEAIDVVRAMTRQETYEQELLVQQHEEQQSVVQRIVHGMWQRKLAAAVAIAVTVLAKPLLHAITTHLF